MTKDLHIIFISNDWSLYHRKFFTEALMKEFDKSTEWLIVNLPISIPVHFFTNFRNKFLKVFSKKKREQSLSSNTILYTPLIFSHYLLWKNFPFTAGIDSFLIKYQLNKFYKKYPNHRKILWLFIPEVASLANSIEYDKLIYDFYDNYSYKETGEIDVERKRQNERLIAKSDLVICTAPFLYEQAKSINNNSYYIPNACNYNTLSSASERRTDGKYIGYLGGIRDWLDFDLIEYLLKNLPDREFLFIGKIYDSAKLRFNELLKSYKNLRHIGHTEQEELIETLKQFHIGLIPFRTNKFFDGMFPNKFFEYMSMGVPIITTYLPALSDYKDIIGYSTSYEEFKNNCLKYMNDDNSELKQLYLKIAKENSWEERGRYLKKIFENLIDF